MKISNILCILLLTLSCSPINYSGTSSSQNVTKSNAQLFQEMNAKMESNVNSYKGTTKQNLILNLGPPTKIDSDGTEKGQVYSYIKSFTLPNGLYTANAYYYIDENNIVYFTKYNYTLQ